MKAEPLLDTCAVIWAANGDALGQSAQDMMNNANSLKISPISAWEIGLLFARGRLSSTLAVGPWLESVLAQPGVDEAEMPVEVLLASSFLPGSPPNDPADRIIIATARHYGYTVITRDRQILAYAAAGHVHAQDC
ncbi:MAG: type II toxin-antitoxin system VapC family toxin [Pseudomonadota bacterium]